VTDLDLREPRVFVVNQHPVTLVDGLALDDMQLEDILLDTLQVPLGLDVVVGHHVLENIWSRKIQGALEFGFFEEPSW
jgi:hypothetical protein